MPGQNPRFTLPHWMHHDLLSLCGMTISHELLNTKKIAIYDFPLTYTQSAWINTKLKTTLIWSVYISRLEFKREAYLTKEELCMGSVSRHDQNTESHPKLLKKKKEIGEILLKTQLERETLHQLKDTFFYALGGSQNLSYAKTLVGYTY